MLLAIFIYPLLFIPPSFHLSPTSGRCDLLKFPFRASDSVLCSKVSFPFLHVTTYSIQFFSHWWEDEFGLANEFSWILNDIHCLIHDDPMMFIVQNRSVGNPNNPCICLFLFSPFGASWLYLNGSKCGGNFFARTKVCFCLLIFLHLSQRIWQLLNLSKAKIAKHLTYMQLLLSTYIPKPDSINEFQCSFPLNSDEALEFF